jgi:hypothetical protein
MDEGKYPASLRMAEVADKPDKNGNRIVDIHVTIAGGDYAGRPVKVRRYTSEKALGMIASDMVALDILAVSTDFDTPTAEEFCDAYNEAAGTDFLLRVKHNTSKDDPSKVYENYSFERLSDE